MHILSVPCAVMAAINFYAAANYVFFFLKRPQAKETISFAALCAGAGLYDVFCAGLYNSTSVAEGVFWQRMQFFSAAIISVSLIGFVFAFTGFAARRLFWCLMGWFLLVFIVSLLAGPELGLSASRPAVKRAGIPGIAQITYYEGEVGPVYLAEKLSAVAAYIFLIVIAIRHCLKARQKTLVPVIASLFAYFAAAASDSMVSMGAYRFIYVSEYAFFIIVLTVACVLLDRFAGLQKAYEDLNSSLERKVRERTAEKEKLQARLFQSEKMTAIGQLAGGVAHEINNPIGVILGFAQSIARRLSQDDPYYQPLKSIEKEAVRCRKIAADLLAFSRTEKTAAETVDINEVIEETLTLAGARARVGNVAVARDFAEGLPAVSVRKNQIQQVVLNLCNNAIDAMPGGGRLTVSTAMDGGRVVIAVADTGTGMTDEMKKRAFEPFYTTKEPGKGTGLGLSLCYDIVQAHNGTIEFESEAGKGTVFRVKIPIAG